MKGIEVMDGGGMIFTGPGITMYRLQVMRSCLKAEIRGFKMVPHSVWAQAKREFGFRGNKEKVLAQLEKHIEKFAVANAS